jgi:hypothetical protein
VNVSDRRDGQRFEIVGHLRGTLALDQEYRILDISTGGALLECHRSLPLGGEHALELVVPPHTGKARGAIRHVRPSGDRYLIGVEFLQLDPLVSAHIDSLTPPGRGLATGPDD